MSDYRVQVVIDGRKIETPQDILPSENKLKILFVGKVPTPFSVNKGHYFQGRQGKMFWNKLKEYDILRVPLGSYEDEQFLEHEYGIIDITKIPREYRDEPSIMEYKEGAKRISDIINLYKPQVVIFIYKRVLDKLLEHAFQIDAKSNYGFNNNLEEKFGSKVFVFPMPGTPCMKRDANKYMEELKEVLDKK